MNAPTTPAADHACAACQIPAVEWVLVMPDTDRPYRALCAACTVLANDPGTAAVDVGLRTWWWL